MKTSLNNFSKNLSNNQTKKIEKTFCQEVIKARDSYLRDELKKYQGLDVKVENSPDSKNKA